MVRLGDEANLQTGNPFKSDSYVEDQSQPRLLRGDNVAQGWLRWEGVKRWPATETVGLEAYWLERGDVVLAMDRPWIDAGLKYAAVNESDIPALLVQRVCRIRGGEALDTGFLRYVIGSGDFTNYVLAVQTGTAVPHISRKQIEDFEFRAPDLSTQRRIAAILGDLDAKIELNRRMNGTLEALARAIFQSWFVDFEPVRAKASGESLESICLRLGLTPELLSQFPETFDESSVGTIPAGWAVCALDDIADYLNGLALQKYPVAEDDDGLPVIKIAQLRAGHTHTADKASAQVPPAYVIENGDVLFSWSGSLEVDIWSGGRGALNQHLFKVTSAIYPKWFYFLWTSHHLASFRDIAANKATTMGHIQRKHLTEAKVLRPPLEVIDEMTKVMSPLIDMAVSCRLESARLAQVRDALLPELLSGNVAVEDLGEST